MDSGLKIAVARLYPNGERLAMSEFTGFNARVVFEKGVVKVIRQEADDETLAQCEKLSTTQKILGLDIHKAKITQVYSHLGIITDPNETTFKVANANDPRTNLVLVEKRDWDIALSVISEIQTALEDGQELLFLCIDPSLLPAKKIKKQSSSPEWQVLARETKELLKTTPPTSGWNTLSVNSPEYPDGLAIQCAFNTSEKLYLEILESEDSPFGAEVKKALKQAGWSDPTEWSPGYSVEVHWSEEDAQNVANFVINTLQWCLFLDASNVTIESFITEDN